MLGAVHEFTLRACTSASVNPEGRPFTTTVDTVVRGHLSNSPEDVKGGPGAEHTTPGKHSEVVLLVARLDADVPVNPNDQVVVTQVTNMNGTYEIVRIMQTARHQRVYLRRMKDL